MVNKFPPKPNEIVVHTSHDRSAPGPHADLQRKLQHGYSTPPETVLHRAKKKGELPEKTDVDADRALTGPLFCRRWFSRDPLAEIFEKRVVRQAI